PRIARAVMSLADKTTPETRNWKDAGWDPTGMIRRRIDCLHDDTCPTDAPKVPGRGFPPENKGGIVWQPGRPNPEFLVIAAVLRVAAGTIAGTSLKLGDVQMTVGDLPRGDASIALVSLDGLPIAESKQMLLVSAARVENTAMRWSADRTGLTSWGH